MGYLVIYKIMQRNWGQHSLDDYNIVDRSIHEKYLDDIEDMKWNLKKSYHKKLQAKTKKKIKPLRRGRKKRRYPSKNNFHMNNSRDVAEVKRFKWFAPKWNQKRKNAQKINSKQNLTLDVLIPNLYSPRIVSHISKSGRFIIPRFRRPGYVIKEEFCNSMSDWAWESCRPHNKSPGLACHIFYLNNFNLFDEQDFLIEIGWGKNEDCLPSDVIKYELLRLLEGFSTYNDFFRMIELMPNVMDHCAINMTHKFPSSHHFTEKLRKITVNQIKLFFEDLVSEARSLGLIQDHIHIWDGQFHETWLKKNKPRQPNSQQFYGGTYNHGGKKVGVGVVQSTIVDWNGVCAIPIHTNIFPANENENIILRKTITNSYKNNNPTAQYFLADRGPSGSKTQELIYNYGMIPIIPLTENVKNGVRITADKENRFYKKYMGSNSDEVLDKLYNIRTRVEEHYNLNETVYKTTRFHCCGKEMTEIQVYLMNCLGVLVPLTAYKIGRPDLMWSPSTFRSLKIHPEKVFPKLYSELNNLRWDNTICESPRNYRHKFA